MCQMPIPVWLLISSIPASWPNPCGLPLSKFTYLCKKCLSNLFCPFFGSLWPPKKCSAQPRLEGAENRHPFRKVIRLPSLWSHCGDNLFRMCVCATVFQGVDKKGGGVVKGCELLLWAPAYIRANHGVRGLSRGNICRYTVCFILWILIKYLRVVIFRTSDFGTHFFSKFFEPLGFCFFAFFNHSSIQNHTELFLINQ